MTYPEMAGFKVPGTSEDAAALVPAYTLRKMVIEFLEEGGPQTADEVAAALGKSVLSIRPRFSELREFGAIADTGLRRPNISGRPAIVWELV
jgi:predicted ArsR family transcriptional regulator